MERKPKILINVCDDCGKEIKGWVLISRKDFNKKICLECSDKELLDLE